MDYFNFHRANSVNTFNMLLDSYVQNQLHNFDEEVFNIFTTQREIEEDEIALVYPKRIFSNPIDEGHKIAVIDIHSYESLKKYYFKECVDIKSFNISSDENAENFNPLVNGKLETKYIEAASRNILTIQTTMSLVPEQLFSILSVKPEGILFGIILNISNKNYNLTHPAVLQLFLDKYHKTDDRICTLYIYINENEENCKTLRDLNEQSYEGIDKEKYLEILKKNILFSCALAKSKSNEAQKIKASTVVDYSAHEIFLTRAEHLTYNISTKGNLDLAIQGYLPSGINFPGKSVYVNIPYYIPIDILARGVFVPYYGGAILHSKLNISTGICETNYEAMNISPFQSGNIYKRDIENNINQFTSACTGSLKEYDLETICSLNYANTYSPYHRSTIARGFLDAIELNIEIARNILANYLRKDIDETNKDNNESNNTSQEGSNTNLQSASNGNSSMETKMAESNNPFERDISYQERISSPYVEPGVS